MSLTSVALSAVFTVTAIAQSGKSEKPSKDFQDVMRSNTAIAPVDGGVGLFSDRRESGGSLRNHLRRDDYEAIAKDVATLKANFTMIEAFFTERRMADAIKLSKEGLKAIADLETATKARDKEGVWKAHMALETTCRNCHVGHRVHVLTVPLQFEIR